MTLSSESLRPRRRLLGVDEQTIPSSEAIKTFEKARETLHNVFTGAARHMHLGDASVARVARSLDLPRIINKQLNEIEDVFLLVRKQDWPRLSTNTLHEASHLCAEVEGQARQAFKLLRRADVEREKIARRKEIAQRQQAKEGKKQFCWDEETGKTNLPEALFYWQEILRRLQILARRMPYLRQIQNDYRRLINAVGGEFVEVDRETAGAMLCLYDHHTLSDSKLEQNEKLGKKLKKAYKLAKKSLKAAQKTDTATRKVRIPAEFDESQWDTSWKTKESVIG